MATVTKFGGIDMTDLSKIMGLDVPSTSSGTGSDPFLTGWDYRKKMTIDNTKVDEDIFDYVVTVKIASDDDLKTTGNGGHVENTNGYDIVFAVGGNIRIPHEVMKYTATTGELVIYVKMPYIDSATDTILYLYYGNSSISTSQEDTESTFSAYGAVMHLDLDGSDGTTYEFVDSTGNTDGGTGTGVSTEFPVRVAGELAYAQDFYVTNRTSIDLASTTYTLLGGTTYTIDFWMRATDSPAAWNRAFGTTQGNNLQIGYGNSDFFYRYNATSMETAADIYSADTWFHVMFVVSAGTVSFYIDGTLRSMSSGGPGANGGMAGVIGAGYNATSYTLIGDVEEFRIYGGARSADYVATQYDNMSSPSTFYSIGTEESA